MTTTFFLPSQQQVDQIKYAHPDHDWHLFGTDAQIRVGQTYSRLIRAGHIVVLSAQVPTDGVVVTHADFVPDLLARRSLLSNLTIVSIRGDRSPQRYADFEVVQEQADAHGERMLHIQDWPQLGLVHRDPERGSMVEKVAIKARAGEVPPLFTEGLWDLSMAKLGIKWRVDVSKLQSNDYTETDVVVALRKDGAAGYESQTASNLTNAWLAGVPAIVGPEKPYRELRRCELDFIEVQSATEALHAVEKLKRTPALYAAMVSNGQQRAVEIGLEACTEAWAYFLFEQLPYQKPAPVPLLRLFLKTMRCRARGSLSAILRISRRRTESGAHPVEQPLANYSGMN